MSEEPHPQNPSLKLRTNRHDHLDPTPREKQQGGTLWSPGRYVLHTATHKALVAVSQLRGRPVNQVQHVRAANIEGDMRVWLYPTDDHDPDRLEVNRYRGKFTVNLSQVLLNWQLALPTRQRRVYDLQIDPQSPVGPALVLHMDKPLAIRWDPIRKKGAPPRRAIPPPGTER